MFNVLGIVFNISAAEVVNTSAEVFNIPAELLDIYLKLKSLTVVIYRHIFISLNRALYLSCIFQISRD